MTTPHLGRDGRKHARAVLDLPVLVSDTSNRVQGGIHFEASDLSAGGAFLESDLLFEVGEVLNLEFRLPSGQAVRARGRVVRVARDQGAERAPGMGVQFIDLAPEDKQAIEQELH